MRNIPTPIDTIAALFKGYFSRVLQARGWMLAGLIMLPFIVVLIVIFFDDVPNQHTALELYHHGYGQMALPIIALIAAPACIREDLEQRTLPMMLARPSPAWALPLGKGLLWFAWCAIWLNIAVALMPLVGLEPASVPQKMVAITLTFWAQLGFAALFLWFFKRGTLWAALFFFIWDPMISVLPAALQRLTFTHYLVSLAGSSVSKENTISFLAQIQVTTAFWLGAAILILFGLLAWGLTGYRLMRMPIGLAGRETEG
jgi:hypothetical protein